MLFNDAKADFDDNHFLISQLVGCMDGWMVEWIIIIQIIVCRQSIWKRK